MNKTIESYLPIVFLYIMSAYFLLDTDGFTSDALLYPKILSYVLIALNTLLLFFTVTKRISESKKNTNRIPSKFLIVFLASIVYTASIKPLGFVLASLIYCPVTALMLGYERKILAFAISTTIIATIYVSFQFILKVPLPAIEIFGIKI